ncbi:C4-dicarboxylate transporter/malic acid transporter [Streptomyces hygroscopicus subsp. jinggangensis 5008]|nr:C4-dicarboxylate transporter/malic acid transporter [Streptomyces hygroscopicus subsp. jinggangensis 5008]
MIGYWLEGGLNPEAMHPGYLLPTVAPGLVGGDVAAVIGYRGLGWALFGVGSFFGVVLTAVVLQRLVFRAVLPDALLPTVAILLAPPAVAGLAWFSLHGPVSDPVAKSLAGMGVLLLLVQAAMLPRYRKLHFSIGFWSFTFPLAASVALTLEWLEITEPAGWRVYSGVLVAVITVFIGVIAARSLKLVERG